MCVWTHGRVRASTSGGDGAAREPPQHHPHRVGLSLQEAWRRRGCREATRGVNAALQHRLRAHARPHVHSDGLDDVRGRTRGLVSGARHQLPLWACSSFRWPLRSRVAPCCDGRCCSRASSCTRYTGEVTAVVTRPALPTHLRAVGCRRARLQPARAVRCINGSILTRLGAPGWLLGAVKCAQAQLCAKTCRRLARRGRSLSRRS